MKIRKLLAVGCAISLLALTSCKSGQEKKGDEFLGKGMYKNAMKAYLQVDKSGKGSDEFNDNYALAMTRLMMQCRVVTGDIIRVFRGPDLHYNGWQTSSFCTPEALFDTQAVPFFAGFEAAAKQSLMVTESPKESYTILKEHIRSLFPKATDVQIARLLA